MVEQNTTERKYKAALIISLSISIAAILWGFSYDNSSVKKEVTNTIFSISFTIVLYVVSIRPDVLINTVIFNSKSVEKPEVIVYKIAAFFWSIVSIVNLINLIKTI